MNSLFTNDVAFTESSTQAFSFDTNQMPTKLTTPVVRTNEHLVCTRSGETNYFRARIALTTVRSVFLF